MDASSIRRVPNGVMLAAILVVGALWAAWGLVRHPGFQPVYVLRASAPVLALMLGAGFTHLLARLRQRVDVDGQFNPTGKALTMGVVMLVATLVAWLLVSQAIPATVTSLVGVARLEPGLVSRRIPATSDADCRFRLEVTSASTVTGAVQRPLDECVDEALWQQVAAGDPVILQLVSGALGAELVGVLAAGAAP
jgi:hypothetical protein